MAVILDVGTVPQTFTSGNWPASALNGSGKWRLTFTPTNASTNLEYESGAWKSIIASGDLGGLWIETSTRNLSLYDSDGNAAFQRAITWGAGTAITVTVDIPNGQVTISGASTGNGTFSFTDIGPYFTGSTSLGVGRYVGDAQYDFAGTIGDIDDTDTGATGTSAGVATVSGSSLGLGIATGTAAGVATVAGDVPGVVTGSSSGIATASGEGLAIGSANGTSAGVATVTGQVPSTLGIGQHGEYVLIYGSGGGNVVQSTVVLTGVEAGSSILVLVSGNLAEVTDGPTATGHTFTRVAPTINAEYSNFPGYGVTVWIARNSGGGNITISQPVQEFDEISWCAIEVKGNPRVRDVKHVWVSTNVSSVQSGTVLANGPSMLISSWWGGGPTGQDHTATPNNSFANLENHLVNDNNGYVQYSADYKEVASAGSYDVTYSHTPSQPAHVWLVALTATDDVATIAGAATVTGAASAIATATGTSSGASTAAATSLGLGIATSTVAGVATAAGDVAPTISTAIGTAAGVATASGSTSSSSVTDGVIAGIAIVVGTSSATGAAAGTAAGVATVAGEGSGTAPPADSANGTSSGTATAAGEGLAIAIAIGTASGIAFAIGALPSNLQGNIMPTRAALIRDHIIRLITEAVPTVLERDRFRVYRNEREGDFVDAAQSQQAGAFRMFQVRDTGRTGSPAVSNTDVTDRLVTYEILIAYPQTHRAGGQNALDRDDVMDADEKLLEQTVGLLGYANFNGIAGPQASWIDGNVARAVGDGVDFLVIQQTMRYHRAA